MHVRDFDAAFRSGTFDFAALGLPEPKCGWLDSTIFISPDFHVPSNGRDHALTFESRTELGDAFPLRPALDREGATYTSFQGMIVRRVLLFRRTLVANSDEPGTERWFQDFRTLVSETVSLIDNTLHQLYYRAKYDPNPGWKFDEAALGPRFGQSMSRKLRWVGAIAGKGFQARDEIAQFTIVKNLRNHLQHFDPPCFAAAWEEVPTWLNAVLGAAQLAWRIRDHVGELPSMPLIELMLEKRVRFDAPDAGRGRLKMRKGLGYDSTSDARLAAGSVETDLPTRVVLRPPPTYRLRP